MMRRRFQLESDQQGVVVTDVAADSPADRGGLQPGDVIEEVNRQMVDSVEDFAAAVTTAVKDQATFCCLCNAVINKASSSSVKRNKVTGDNPDGVYLGGMAVIASGVDRRRDSRSVDADSSG